MNNFDFQQQQKMNIQKAQFLQMQMKKQQMDNPVLSQFMAQQQRAVQAQSQFRQFPQQQQQMNFPMMQSGRPDKPEEQSELITIVCKSFKFKKLNNFSGKSQHDEQRRLLVTNKQSISEMVLARALGRCLSRKVNAIHE